MYDPRMLGQEETNEETDMNYNEKRAKQIAWREKLERKAKQLDAAHKKNNKK